MKKAALFALGLAAPALAASQAPASVEGPDAVLLLIGDAGAPSPRGEPVLKALAAEAGRDPQRTTVVFLGDNVYPRGLPRPEDRGRAEGERRLAAQLDAVRLPGVRAVLLPGNHDWDEGGEDGLAAVRRQAAFVRERGSAGTAFVPADGCPGPEVRDVGSRVRLVLLDTQWFLHAHDKPRDPDSSCAADSYDEVVAALGRALDGAGGRLVLVASHHPLESAGPHGGRFGVRQHVFPLTDWKRWLWLPLPGIGSAYPAARKAGVTPQDLPSEENTKMRNELREPLEERPPLAWVSGHEHSLQVIATGAPHYQLVSGAGIFGHTTSVLKLPGLRFGASEAGFMRLVVPHAGPPRLAVLVVDKQGRARERFSMDLE